MRAIEGRLSFEEFHAALVAVLPQLKQEHERLARTFLRAGRAVRRGEIELQLMSRASLPNGKKVASTSRLRASPLDDGPGEETSPLAPK